MNKMSLLKVYTTTDLPVYLLILMVLMLIVAFVFIFFIVMFLRKREMNFLIEKSKHEKIHFASLFSVFSNEKELLINRIALELHDNISQLLASLSLKLNTLKITDQQKEVQAIQADCTALITQLRSLSYLLSSDIVSQYQLHEILDSLMENYRSMQLENLPDFSFMVNGTPKALPKEIELIVYRTVQELISNVIKHAQASYCELIMYYQAQALDLVLYDNGKGFDWNAVQKGLGLSSIHNKEVLMDGSIQFSFPDVGGTKIEIHIPYTAQPLSVGPDMDLEHLSKRFEKLSTSVS